GALDSEVLVLLLRAAPRRAGLGAVDDHLAAVHPAEVDAGLADDQPRRRVRRLRPVLLAVVGALVVVARADEDPVAGLGGIDRRLNRLVLALLALPLADAQHAGVMLLLVRRLGRGHQRHRGDQRREQRDEDDRAPLPTPAPVCGSEWAQAISEAKLLTSCRRSEAQPLTGRRPRWDTRVSPNGGLACSTSEVYCIGSGWLNQCWSFAPSRSSRPWRPGAGRRATAARRSSRSSRRSGSRSRWTRGRSR